MQYQTFDPQTQQTYPVAFLVPKLSEVDMLREYIHEGNLDPKEAIGYELYTTGKKTPGKVIKAYLEEDLLPVLDDLDVQYLMVSDPDYFKILTGVGKADPYLGYVLGNKFPEALEGRFRVLFCPNYRQIFYDPGRTRSRIKQSLDALWSHLHGQYREPGCSIISFSDYPTSPTAIAGWLQKLIDMDVPLSCDIEGFSLKHYDAGIGTICFTWNKHEGIAFPVDLGPNPPEVRALLMHFFRTFEGPIRYHNIAYDVSVLIYQLFMNDITDTRGLLEGLEVMLKNWDCTKLISYLATNTTAGNNLGLKDQAQEFAGNYAVEEIKDITKIPLPQLLEYNLVDGLSTHYVYEKHWQTLIDDEQLEIYETLFKPAMVDIIQMQLTGMPLDMQKVAEAKTALSIERGQILQNLSNHPLVQELTYTLNEEWVEKRNSELKVKRVSMADACETFNPNSPIQVQRLIYDLAELPVKDLTKSKQPSTKAKVLEKLKAFTQDQSTLDLIDLLLAFAAVDKVYGTFIPAMEEAQLGADGCYYLFGNFNLGGTASGRLSSSNPNLQTIPANSKFAKVIKDCFRAPPGWLMVGLDFASLEDRISALTTRDPNKLKVYTDGFDGHALRAQSYFTEDMPDIELAPDGARCFSAKYGSRTVWFHERETVTYLGQTMTGAELWDRLQNLRENAA